MEKRELKKIVSVFKTNIQKQQLNRLTAALNNSNKITRWTIDFEDCDHILRIESHEIISDEVIAKLTAIGFKAEELND